VRTCNLICRQQHSSESFVTTVRRISNLYKTINVGAFVQPLLQWESSKYYIIWIRVSCLKYPTWNAHAPYCHPLPAPLYNMFPHYLINGRIFDKKNVTDHKMCVLIFSTNFVWNISNSKKKWARYGQKRVLVFMWSACYSCQILIKLIFVRFSKNVK